MRVSAPALTLSIATLMAGGTFAVSSPAGAAPGSAHRAASATMARAHVTDIREIVNTLPTPLRIYDAQDGVDITIQPNSRWNGSMYIPWAGDDNEVKDKAIRVLWTAEGSHVSFLYQDYWDPRDQIELTRSPTYVHGRPTLIGGSSTGAGRKRLTFQNGTVYSIDLWIDNVG